MKKILVLVLALMLVVSSMAALAELPELTKEPLEILLWDIAPEEPNKSIQEGAVQRFMADYPNITVKQVHQQNDNYKQQLVVAMSAGECPDMYIHWAGGPMAEYYKSGFVNDLTEMYNKYDHPDFIDAAVAQASYDGKILSIPFGGLSGCGMHEIGRAAFGLEKLAEGHVYCGDKEIKSCLDAIENGIGYISKNRDTEALILEGSIAENIVLPSINALSKGTFVNPKAEKRLSDGEIDNFRIKCYSGKQWVNTLSGGNKQKVSFSKWTAKKSDVLIMDCPTRGVDIGVKQFMYHVIAEMKKEGKSIILISEELAELIGMADKILIMKDFEVTHEFMRSPSLSETDIIEYMI